MLAEGSSLTAIGERVFANCVCLEKIRLPDGLKSIARSTFFQCSSLESIRLPDGLEKIGQSCLCGAGIQRIVVPKGITEIQGSAFCGCANLREVAFGEGAFRSCTSLEKTRLPDGLKSIGCYAFLNCKSLRNIRLPNWLERICMGCFRESGLEEVVLQASVREVGAEAFYECKWLKHVQLNEGLEKLGESAGLEEREGGVFRGTAVESIRLPSTLEIIGSEVFEGCDSLIIVWVEEGCAAGVEGCVPESVRVVSVRSFQALTVKPSEAAQKQHK